uniref:Sorting nexin 1 n=1 Tax=Anas platyrhynchos platyrhynchos TaxID=8840 RepID=A0A493U3K6_ANAPP
MTPGGTGKFPLNFDLPAKGRGFWWLRQLPFHFCNCLLQKEKSKDFRKHVTKYLETLLNSQQQVSVPGASSQPSFTSWSFVRAPPGTTPCGGSILLPSAPHRLERGTLPTVFLVEVLCNGRRHTVAKRYSEFQALHKRIKKTCKVPDFPPRRVPNWVPKVLEQRRQGLELYIQGVLCRNKELPQDVLDFLKVRRCQQDPKGSSAPGDTTVPWCCASCASPSIYRGCQAGHRAAPAPLLADALPDTVLSGVLQGLYAPWSCSPRTAVAQGQPGS